MTAEPPPPLPPPPPAPPAMPPQPPAPGPARWDPRPSGSTPSSLPGNRGLLTFLAVFGTIIALVVVVILVTQGHRPPPPCPDPTIGCGGPPIDNDPKPTATLFGGGPGATSPIGAGSTFVPGTLPVPVLPNPDSPALHAWTTWSFDPWGILIEHPDTWGDPKVQPNGDALINLAWDSFAGHSFSIRMRAALTAETSPEAMQQALQQEFVDPTLGAVDPSAEDRVLRPTIGRPDPDPAFQQLPAMVFSGVEPGDGAGAPVRVVILAASDGHLTIGITISIVRPDDRFACPATKPDCELGDRSRVFRAAGYNVDHFLQRLEWPAEP